MGCSVGVGAVGFTRRAVLQNFGTDANLQLTECDHRAKLAAVLIDTALVDRRASVTMHELILIEQRLPTRPAQYAATPASL